MMCSNGTKVNRDFTSNNTILQFPGIFSHLILLGRTFELLIVQLD